MESFLFQEVKDLIQKGSYTKPNWEEIKKAMLTHAKLLLETKSDKGLFDGQQFAFVDAME